MDLFALSLLLYTLFAPPVAGIHPDHPGNNPALLQYGTPVSVNISACSHLFQNEDGYLQVIGATREELRNFGQSLEGGLSNMITPYSDTWGTSAVSFNGFFKRCVLLVVYSKTSDDVVKAVNFARERSHKVCSRSGGHSFAGFSTCEGVLIDFSQMTAMNVDQVGLTLKVQPGAQWEDVDQYLSSFSPGLHTPGGGCNTVSVSGWTLGGGMGLTSRTFGMGSDNLVSAEVVLADGSLIQASETEHSDILWALRGGGGGNFGVVTHFVFKLRNLDAVSGFSMCWDLAVSPEVLKVFQQNYTLNAGQDNTNIYVFFFRSGCNPRDGISRSMVFQGLFVNTSATSDVLEDQARKALQPLLDTKPASFEIGHGSYHSEHRRVLGNFHVEFGRFSLKSASGLVTRELTTDDFRYILDNWAKWPTSENMFLENYGGAIGSIPTDATAFPHRNAYFNMVLNSWGSTNPGLAHDAQIERIKNIYDGWKPFFSGGVYRNYPDLTLEDYTDAYYKSNFPRLLEIREHVDPELLFDFDQAVKAQPQQDTETQEGDTDIVPAPLPAPFPAPLPAPSKGHIKHPTEVGNNQKNSKYMLDIPILPPKDE